ncbi:PH domain-containing protein [Patescibacteria group bacterium]|nr:PH domain-containing protein [Patescibacteria group bacterium]MBU1867926.1 PH domain-containing protein [Patescibacteria group bacterium]
MNGIITEKNYPVQGLWIFKSMLGFLLLLIFFVPYSLASTRSSETSKYTVTIFYIVIIAGFAIFHFIVTILRRANFHYSIEENFLTSKQGILSKQQRHIPYGVIQTLLVKQDLFDRVFGLASLTIENAAQGAGYLAVPRQQKVFGIPIGTQQKRQVEMVGFSGNKVNIPGLTKQNAETLKNIVLQKMKENPIEDSQSGL